MLCISMLLLLLLFDDVYIYDMYIYDIYINNELYIDVCQSTPSRCEYLWTSCECIVDASRCE
jgi:hypothetical protein